MFVSVEDFLGNLYALTAELLPKARIRIVYARIDKVSLRITINTRLFIDVYFNADTRRFDFSLINNNSRVFGYDNLKYWHLHPYANPCKHILCDPPDLRLVFQEAADIITIITQSA